TRLSACPTESVTGPGFTARLDNQRDLPKFRAKGVEYVVKLDDTEDLRETFASMLEAWVPRGGCALENKHLEERHAFSKHYVRITNTDKRCLLRALVVACAYLQFVAKRITEQVWRRSFWVDALPEAIRALNRLHPGHDFGVRVYRAEEANRCIFNLPGTEILHLHLVEQHFNVVTKLPAFFGSHHYCAKCEMAYDCGNAKHKCADACSTCKTPGSNCKVNRAYVRCQDCGLNCYNAQCLENHKRKNKAGRSRCDSVHVCGTCGYLEELKVGQRPEHQCGYAKCPVCKQYDETATHECFVTPPKAKESSAPYVYYDFETYVDSGKQHRVHLVTAATSCEACPKLFPRPRCGACGGYTAQPIALRDAIWRAILRAVSRTMTVPGAIAIAHNGSAYDAFLLLGALLNGLAKKKPQVIFQNSRLMYMKCDKITFKDSLNFIPIGLAQFPKALGLGTQLTKGDFPHVFNQPQNWGYVGPYCSIDMYGGKKNKQHDSIADWLAKQEGRVFNFNKEYLDYCLQDTLILREGCLKYTRLIKDICGLDAFVPIQHHCGLGHGCIHHQVYGAQHSWGDFPPIDVQSHKARCWLAHLNATEFGGRLRTADSGGEAFAMGRKVDGFDRRLGQCCSFMAVSYHGCPKCFPNGDVLHPLKNQPMRAIYEETERFTRLLSTAYNVRVLWEHDYQDEGAPVQQPIRLEEALFGGRTEAFVPHAEATETVELRYRDVLKAESSGSPGMTEDAKAAYMASFFEREGVRLEKVEENPGLRFVAKIFLNSLWGKFCQRDDLTSTEIVDSYEAWLQRLTDPSIKVKSCEPIGECFMMLEYKPRIGVAGERAFKYANVPIGVFTTSHARLRLYEALGGVVYRCSPGEYEPPGGSSLGQWTDEVPAGCRMVQFTTGGPKLYRYVVEKPDGSLYSVLKCKGIRVTPEIAEREAELQEILRHGGTVRLPQAQFRRDKASCTIRTLEMDKTFQRVMTKRVYGSGSRPYGFRE
uniref:DNA-directed DNA polymerase n=1 Tax=Macrostomum lignano TaxID=282301 RepID=A0A1I8ILM5_9PLAT